MSGRPRLLLIADVAPEMARRRAALIALFAAATDTTVLFIGAPAGARLVSEMRARAVSPGFATPEEAPDAMAALHLAGPFDVIHLASRSFAGPSPDGPLLIRDRAAGAQPGEAALRLTSDVADKGVFAPFLGRGPRRARATPSGARGLAGLWVEETEAAETLFAAIRARGGGLQPNLLVGGPAARGLRPPSLAFPVTIAPAETAEETFWRAVDLAIFPLGGGEAALAALALGATPMIAGPAPFGREDIWRLPRFTDAPALAEYLFERGRDLRHGGLMAELRALADWTWSGWAGEAAEARAAIHGALRAAKGRST